MFSNLIFDIIIVLVLAFFAWRGAKKGLILTLFGLLGLVVAIFGARFISNTFYEPVANIIEPGIHQSLEELERESLNSIDFDATAKSSVESIAELLRERDLFPALVDLLDSVHGETDEGSSASLSAVDIFASQLADLAARIFLYIASFVLILLIWFLISHILDLTFRLPILSTINFAGGLILGLVKAIAIIVVLVWFLQLMGIVPAEPTTPILSLFTPEGIRNALNKVVT